MSDKQKINLGFDTSIQIDYNWDKATQEFYNGFSKWVKNLDVSSLEQGLNTSVDKLLNMYVTQTTQGYSRKVVETVKYSLEDATKKARAEMEKVLAQEEKALQQRMSQGYKESSFKKMQDIAKAEATETYLKSYGAKGKRKQEMLGSHFDITKAEKAYAKEKQRAKEAQEEYFSFLDSPLPSFTKEDKIKMATLRAKKTRLEKAGKALSTTDIGELEALEQRKSDDSYKKEVLTAKLGKQGYADLIKEAQAYHEIRMRQEQEYANLLQKNNAMRAKGVSESDIAKHREVQRERTVEVTGREYHGEARRVETAMRAAQTHRINNEKTLKALEAKAFRVELDEDTHTYYKLNKDGSRSKKQPEIVSVTQLAGAISSGDQIKPLMDKVKAGEAKGLLPEQILNASELSFYKNTMDAASRGTAIHKVIELLETNMVTSVSQAVKFLDQEVAELTAQGKKNLYGTSYKNKEGNFTWEKTIDDYFALKKQYGLGEAVLSEKQLGMQVSVPKADGTRQLVNLAGTLDTLLTGGHLFDFKTTKELHGQNLTIQDNLLSLLLTASKNAGIISQDAGDMGVIHLNNGTKGAEGSYVAKVGQATTEEIVSWFQSFVSGKIMDVQNRVEQQFEFMDWTKTGRNKAGQEVVLASSAEYGPTIGIAGKSLGTYVSEYNKAWAKANPSESGLSVVDEATREQIRNSGISKAEADNVIKTTVTVSEMITAQQELNGIVSKLTQAYHHSLSEVQEAFARRVFNTGYGANDAEKAASLMDYEGDKHKLYSALRANFQDEMARYQEDVTEAWRYEPKVNDKIRPEGEDQAKEKLQYDTNRLRNEGVGSGPIQSVSGMDRKVADIVRKLTGLLDGLDKALIDGTEEQITTIKQSIKNTAQQLFSSLNIARQEFKSSYVDRFGVAQTAFSDATSDAEKVWNDQNTASIQAALGQGRSQVVKDFISSELFNIDGSKYSDNISMQDYTNISTNKALKLVEASVTMDNAFAELARTLNITTEEAKKLMFQSSSSMKAEYEMSQRARKAFMDNGIMPQTAKEVEQGLDRMMALGYKDISNLFGTLEVSDKSQVYEKILQSINSGVGGRTQYGNKLDNSIADIMIGRSPFLSQKVDYNKMITQEDGSQSSMAIRGIESMLDILTSWKTEGFGGSDLTRAISTLTQILEMKKIGPTPIQDNVSHRVFYDTETTGTDRTAMPVTFGAYNTQTGEQYHKYLDYGSDEKNLEMALSAMNITGDDGQLIKSSLELRKSFGILEEEVLELATLSEANKSKILSEYNANKVGPEKLMSDILGMAGTTGGLAGFNNKVFDNEILGRYMIQYGSSQALSDFQRFLSLPNQDVLQEATQAFGKNGNFTGQLNLQSLAELFLGQMDASAHNASADAKTTALISEFVHNGVLNLIGQMTRNLATEQNVAITNGEGYFTDAYKQIVANVFGAVKTLGMGQTLTAQDTSTVQTLVKGNMGLGKEAQEVAKVNAEGQEHIGIVEGMADAEKHKIIVSKELAAQLAKEQQAVEGVTNAVRENTIEDNKAITTSTNGTLPTAESIIQKYQEQKKSEDERKKLIKEAKDKNKKNEEKANNKKNPQLLNQNGVTSTPVSAPTVKAPPTLEDMEKTYREVSKEVEEKKERNIGLQKVLQDNTGTYDKDTLQMVKEEYQKNNGFIKGAEKDLEILALHIKEEKEAREKSAEAAKRQAEASQQVAQASQAGQKGQQEQKKEEEANVPPKTTSEAEKFYESAKSQAISEINYEKERNALKEISTIDKQALKQVEKVAQGKEQIAQIEQKQQDLLNKGYTKESETYQLLQKQKDALQSQVALDGQLYDNLIKKRNLIAQNITTDKARQDLRDQNTTFQVEAQGAAERGIRQAVGGAGAYDTAENKAETAAVNKHISSLKEQFKLERDITRLKGSMQGQTGMQLRDSQNLLASFENQLSVVKAITDGYNRQNGTLNGVTLSEKARIALNEQIDKLQKQQSAQLTEINSKNNRQKGILSQIASSFKMALKNMTVSYMGYTILNKIKQAINQVITATKNLDKQLVNIQIATGQTRKQTRELLIEYSHLAKEMGRSTESVATASNDWLRAGYEGKEAAELTRASMMLSTLGMIEASEATTYLISTLKGWKIEANEVIDVVDKLSAVDMQAAISAGELALAMSRANASARIAGSDMNNFIGYVTTIADRTQKSAESVGESMKTLYARYGNVKVNKFAASQEEMESENYNEEEYESLNDLETVLSGLGIKLRENAKEWRDFDTVLQDIADHWENWDLTTKNAVSTAFAGTRQRENFLTLMDSWEDVGKYVNIASEAYGTATSKMEAYTDSVEAAQGRVSVAIEQWALWANGANTIKDFYNSLAFAIENIGTLVLAIGGLAVALNLNTVLGAFTSGISKMVAKSAEMSMVFDQIKINLNSSVGNVNAYKKQQSGFINETLLFSQQKMFSQTLTKYTATLGEAEVLAAQNAQSYLLSIQGKERETVANALLTETSLKKLSVDNQDLLLKALSATLTEQEINSSSQNMATVFKKIAAGEELAESDNRLDAINEALILLRKKQYSKELGKNMLLANKMGTPQQMAFQGTGMVVGSILGGQAFSTLTKDLGGTASILGTVLGGMMGSYAGKALIGGLGNVISGGAFWAGIANPFLAGAAILTSGVALIASKIKKDKEEAIKEAQEAFKEAEEEYTAAKEASFDTARYEELAKGVNKLGKNVSLTEEEFQEFLDIGNNLSELFPGLIEFIDADGNAILKMGDSIESLTERVNKLTEAKERYKNIQLFKKDEGLFGTGIGTTSVYEDALKNAQKEANDYQVQINSANRNIQNAEKASVKDGRIYNADFNYALQNYVNNNTATEGYHINMNSNGGLEIAYHDGYNFSDAEKEAINFEIQEILSSFIGEQHENLANAQLGYEAVLASMADYSHGLINLNEKSSNIVNNMGETEKTILNTLIPKIDITDPDYNENTAIEMVNQIDKLFNTNEGERLLDYSTKSADNYTTVGAQQDAINKAKADLQTLVDSGEYENILPEVIVTLGFELSDTGEILDNSLLTQFKEKMELVGLSYSDEQLRSLTPTELRTGYELLGDTISSTYTEFDSFLNLIKADTPIGNTLEELKANLDSVSERGKTLMPELTNLVNSQGGTNMLENLKGLSDEEIDNIFSEYGSDIRGAIKNFRDDAIEEIENGEDVGKAMKEFYQNVFNTQDAKILEAYSDYTKGMLAGAFENVDLNEDGLVSDFNELKDVMDSLADSYERLKEAQQEQNAMGKLSLATALDLITTDSMYLGLLDTTGGKIRLRADAEEVLMNAKLNAAKAGMTQMQAELLQEAQTLQTALTTDTLVETLNNEIAVNEQVASSNDSLANSYLNQYQAVKADALATMGLNYAQAGDNAGAISAIESADAAAGQAGTASIKTEYTATQQESTGLTEQQKNSYLARLEAITGINKNDMFNFDENGNITGTKINLYDAQYGLGGTFKYGGELGTLEGLLTMTNIDTYKSGLYKYEGDEDKKTFLEHLQDLESAINKEWEAMMAKQQNRYTEYFEKMRLNLEAQQAEITRALAFDKLTEEERLDYEKQLQEVQVKINNLDDEELEDKMKILENLDSSIQARIILQRQLIEAADTEEELIERQKELNELLKEEQELRRDIRDYQKELIDTELEYESGTPNSDKYQSLVSKKQALYAEDMTMARFAIQDARNKAYQGLKAKNYDDQGNQILSDSELWYFANNSEEVQEAVKNYIEAFQSAAELAVQIVEDKIEALQDKLDVLDMEKPVEWSSIDDINDYYDDKISILEDKIDIYEKALEDTSNLTDEQIKNIVNSINEATKELQQAEIDRREDIKAQDDKYYEAITWQVNQYIEEIELAKEANDEWYDDAIKKLQDYNDDLDRTNKLLELQNKLKSASQEKERVYREGIGWVYETPRQKVKDAQKELDQFYLQDQIDDLNNTRDAENKILDERIKNWQDYLKMLEAQYGRYEAMENQRILMERMNVETQEEIDAIIKQDMADFVAYSDAKMDEGIDNYYDFYNDFNTWFSDFFESYEANLEELRKLKEELLELLDIEDYIDGNGINIEGGSGVAGTQTQADEKSLEAELDMDEDYSNKIAEAIKDGNLELAYHYGDLRELKAKKKGITLGQGGYRTNEQVIDDAIKKYWGDYESFYAHIEENTESNKATNTSISNQTSQMNSGFSGTQNAINTSATNTQNAITQGTATTQEAIGTSTGQIVDAINSIELPVPIEDMLDGSEMTPDEIEEALQEGEYVNMGTFTDANGQQGHIFLDPNKKPDVYSTHDEDLGAIGSKAWFNEVRSSPTWSKEDINNVVAQVVAEDAEREATREITSMKRNKNFAGQEITVGGVTVRYDDKGYAVAQVKNERHVDDNGNIYYTSASGERREVTDLSEFVNTDQISSNVKNVATALDAMGYGIDSVVGNVITTIAAKSNQEISASQAQLLAEQAIASGISTSSASLIGVNNVGNDLISGISTSFEEALEYLKNIDSNTVESINSNYGEGDSSGGSSDGYNGKVVDGKYYSGMSAQGGANTDYSKEDTSRSKTGTYDRNTDYSAAYQNASSDEERKEIEEARQEKIDNEYGGVDPNPNWKGHADGIKSGPVTYTGLAMLHGSPQEPEYVLNNDQAYNLLYNLSAARDAKMAEFDRVKTTNSGTQYVVQGDIILEGVDNPAEFWKEVTNAMGNRWNVTKNR